MFHSAVFIVGFVFVTEFHSLASEGSDRNFQDVKNGTVLNYESTLTSGGLLLPKYRTVNSTERHEDSAVPKKFYQAQYNCNPHPYNFTVIPSQTCLNKEVYMLILVRSATDHFERRKAIRETWGDGSIFEGLYMPVRFVIGKSDSDRLKEEISQYGDIIQENFIDTYKTLFLKDVTAYRWVFEYCPHAVYVMMTSDEVLVDMFKIIHYLGEQRYRQNMNSFSFCYYYPCCTKVYRLGAKYSVSEKDYPGTAYPAYCSGTLYIMPGKAIKQLYLMSFDTPPFMPDDAWIGVMAEKLDIKFTDTSECFVGLRRIPTVEAAVRSWDYATSPVMVAVLDYDFPGKEDTMMRTLWSDMVIAHSNQYSTFWNSSVLLFVALALIVLLAVTGNLRKCLFKTLRVISIFRSIISKRPRY